MDRCRNPGGCRQSGDHRSSRRGSAQKIVGMSLATPGEETFKGVTMIGSYLMSFFGMAFAAASALTLIYAVGHLDTKD
jgi:hypothetical protein